MTWHFALLWSDWILWFIVLALIGYGINATRSANQRASWREVGKSKIAMICVVILAFYMAIALADSIHIRFQGQAQLSSLLDIAMQPISQEQEKTYSSPFSDQLFVKTIVNKNGRDFRTYAPLKFVHVKGTTRDVLSGLFTIGIILLLLYSFVYWLKRKINRDRESTMAWKTMLATFSVMLIVCNVCWELSHHFHIFGTDKIGRDVFYLSLKSIRTGVLIGTLTTIFMLPFALFFGAIAGFFRGIVDDIIQYLYTTLSSIPGVLLITATILVMQVYIQNHQSLFPTLASRADARLLALCFILGITSWTSLCRLIRAETMKLREMDYVSAAQVMGVSRTRILTRHILPNVMHIVMITLVLDFSGLVLAEAVLSYVGVGVDPTTISWGNMINAARLELSRRPMVWWPLASAMGSMFVLVLCANLFADRVRDAFDPRNR